jgi:plastocyanin
MSATPTLASIALAGLMPVFIYMNGFWPAARATPTTYTVAIRHMAFQPQTLTLKKGDTVVFINQDLVAHDVTEQSRKAWSSAPLPASRSWRMVATKSAAYYCSLHPVMKGKLVVMP